MSWIQKEFGKTLRNHDGTTGRLDASSATHIVVYFSASWCGPCKKFTPLLRTLHKNLRKRVKVIFVSLDSSRDAFQQYHSDNMEWPAVHFSEADMRNSLRHKCGVTSIPHVSLLCARSGAILHSNIRNEVEVDPSGSRFPWGYSFIKTVCSDVHSNQFHEMVKVVWDRPVAFYFSAGYSEHCRLMDPVVRRAFSTDERCRLVLVGLDKDLLSFSQYFSREMPRHAYGISDPEKISRLRQSLNIHSIPTLVTLNSESKIINANATAHCRLFPTNAPWTPQIVEHIDLAGNVLNSKPCVVLLLPKANKKMSAAFRHQALMRRKTRLKWFEAVGESATGNMLREQIVGNSNPCVAYIHIPTKKFRFIKYAEDIKVVLDTLDL